MPDVPNFLIVGAPKCGTTALRTYLADHPQVFVPSLIEPRYFAHDRLRSVVDAKTYSALFAKAGPDCRAFGEASPQYLYSDSAMHHIHAWNPRMKLIAMLRNPIDAVASYHAQLLATGFEAVPDLMAAWRLRRARLRGEYLPPNSRDAMALHYDKTYQYVPQLKHMWSVFPQDQTLVLLYDDFRESPRDVYVKVEQFLGIDDDGRTDFEPVNERKRARSQALAALAGRPPRPLLSAAAKLRTALGVQTLGIRGLVKRCNRVPADRIKLGPDERGEIRAVFADDIVELARLLSRDLSHWT